MRRSHSTRRAILWGLALLVAAFAFDKLILDPPPGWVIPVYPGAQERTGRGTGNCGAYQTSASPATVAAWYAERGLPSQMTAGGVALHGANFQPVVLSLPFSAKKLWLGRAIEYQVYSQAGRTYIDLTCTPASEYPWAIVP